MNRNEQILLAAERCMRHKGFHQASVQNIAAEAGISIGLIYRYYKNKEAIIEALVVMTVQRLKDLHDADLDFLAQSDSTAGLLSPEVEHNIALLMEVSSEATRNPHIRQIITDAWQELKANFIQQQQALHPECDAGKTHARLYAISLIIDGIIIRRSMKQGEITADFMATCDTLLHTLYQYQDPVVS